MLVPELAQAALEEVEDLRVDMEDLEERLKFALEDQADAEADLKRKSAALTALSRIDRKEMDGLRNLFQSDTEAQLKAKLWDSHLAKEEGHIVTRVKKKIREFSRDMDAELLTYSKHVMDIMEVFDIRLATEPGEEGEVPAGVANPDSAPQSAAKKEKEKEAAAKEVASEKKEATRGEKKAPPKLGSQGGPGSSSKERKKEEPVRANPDKEAKPGKPVPKGVMGASASAGAKSEAVPDKNRVAPVLSKPEKKEVPAPKKKDSGKGPKPGKVIQEELPNPVGEVKMKEVPNPGKTKEDLGAPEKDVPGKGEAKESDPKNSKPPPATLTEEDVEMGNPSVDPEKAPDSGKEKSVSRDEEVPILEKGGPTVVEGKVLAGISRGVPNPREEVQEVVIVQGSVPATAEEKSVPEKKPDQGAIPEKEPEQDIIQEEEPGQDMVPEKESEQVADPEETVEVEAATLGDVRGALGIEGDSSSESEVEELDEDADEEEPAGSEEDTSSDSELESLKKKETGRKVPEGEPAQLPEGEFHSVVGSDKEQSEGEAEPGNKPDKETEQSHSSPPTNASLKAKDGASKDISPS